MRSLTAGIDEDAFAVPAGKPPASRRTDDTVAADDQDGSCLRGKNLCLRKGKRAAAWELQHILRRDNLRIRKRQVSTAHRAPHRKLKQYPQYRMTQEKSQHGPVCGSLQDSCGASDQSKKDKTKKEALRELLRRLADIPEIADRITITIKPKKVKQGDTDKPKK